MMPTRLTELFVIQSTKPYWTAKGFTIIRDERGGDGINKRGKA